MIDVSEELKDAFLSHTQKNIQLSFTDTSYNLTGNDLKLEAVTLEQSICDETILTFGKCSSSCFKFTMKNNNKSYKNLEFDVTLTAYDFEGNSYPLSLGHYIVYEDTVSDDRNYRSIVAYDTLKAVMQTDYKDWYHSLTFPMSLKAFRDAFFLHISINQESKVLINDDFIVKDTINADVLTGQTIIEAICELNCAFGNIGYDGNFRYVTFVQDAGLYPRNDLYPSDELYPDDPNVSLSVTDANYLLGTFVYQDYLCQKIDSVRIMEDEDDDGTVVGTGDNQYTISGNFLIFGSDNTQRQTIGERFLEFCEDFFYTPTKIEMWGQPWLEVGDLVQVIGKTTALVFPILHRTLSGITALKDSYEAQGSETYEKASNTLSSQFEKYRSKTMKMERTVDEFYQEYKEYGRQTNGTLESHSSRIQQNADNISSEVARATGSENSLSSSIIQTAESIESEVRRATGAEGNLSSRISQSAHTIDLSVSGTAGQGTSAGITISLYDENGNLLDSGSGNITLDGNVIFKSNLTDGQTVISGNNITTGYISCDRLNGGTITGQKYYSTSGNFQVNADGKAIANQFLAKDFLQLLYPFDNNSVYLSSKESNVLGVYTSSSLTNFGGIHCGEVHFDFGKWIRWYDDPNHPYSFYQCEIGTNTYDTADTVATTIRNAAGSNGAIRLTLERDDDNHGIRYQKHNGAYAFTPYGDFDYNNPMLGTSANPWGKLYSKNIITGRVSLTPGSAGAIVSTTVTFNEDSFFRNTPRAFVTAQTSVPDKVSVGIVVADDFPNEATIYLYRTNTTTTKIDYLIIF